MTVHEAKRAVALNMLGVMFAEYANDRRMTEADALAMAIEALSLPTDESQAVAWLRYRPDGTPDWAEDCVAEDNHFLDHELKSDGYYLQPLYTTPPVVEVDEAAVQRAFDAYWAEPHVDPNERIRRAITAALKEAT